MNTMLQTQEDGGEVWYVDRRDAPDYTPPPPDPGPIKERHEVDRLSAVARQGVLPALGRRPMAWAPDPAGRFVRWPVEVVGLGSVRDATHGSYLATQHKEGKVLGKFIGRDDHYGWFAPNELLPYAAHRDANAPLTHPETGLPDVAAAETRAEKVYTCAVSTADDKYAEMPTIGAGGDPDDEYDDEEPEEEEEDEEDDEEDEDEEEEDGMGGAAGLMGALGGSGGMMGALGGGAAALLAVIGKEAAKKQQEESGGGQQPAAAAASSNPMPLSVRAPFRPSSAPRHL